MYETYEMTRPAVVSPKRLPNPAINQMVRSIPKLTKAATIWFSVSADANSPRKETGLPAAPCPHSRSRWDSSRSR